MKAPSRARRRTLAVELLPVCLDVEVSIAGKAETEAKRWAAADASRHSHTLVALLEAAAAHQPLKVLNASGLYHGHQDFSLATALRKRGIDFEWTTHESGDSPYLSDPRMTRYLHNLNINVVLIDYREPLVLSDNAFNVILFTEIAEHLDHSALLRSLAVIRNALTPDGLLILTTPNLVSLPNRLRVLLGMGDQPFFGDGRANLEAGLYGHIAAYDVTRLSRLLLDAGLATVGSYTFDWGRAWRPGLASRLVTLASAAVPGAGQSLLVLASPGDRVEIPFET